MLDTKIIEKQLTIKDEKMGSSCFVTFGSSAQAIKALNDFSWVKVPMISGARVTSRAPLGDGAKEVFWPNVGVASASITFTF